MSSTAYLSGQAQVKEKEIMHGENNNQLFQ